VRWILFVLLVVSQCSWANRRTNGLPIDYHHKMLEHFSTDGHEGRHAYFFRDADGFRDRLADQGVTVSLVYGNDVMANPVGGISRGVTSTGSLEGGVAWQPDEHFLAYGSAIYQSGTSLSNRRIGNAFLVQQLALSETLFLNELLVRVSLCDDRIQFKLGRLNAGDDFLQGIYHYNYVSSAFNGNPIGIFFNVPMSVYPIATWGAVLSLSPTPRWEWRGGAFNANTRLFQNRFHGLNFTFKNSNGWLLMNEVHYRHQLMPCDLGLPGRYVAGLYYQTGRTDLLRGRKYPFDYGGYIMADQMIFRLGGPGSKRGIIPWTAVLFAPAERNRLPLYFNVGLVVQGPQACRPFDSINFGLAHGEFAGSQTSETLLEFNYWWQARPWLAVTPAIEYVINPRGLGTISNAFVAGVQIFISL
jgi:porin